MTRDGYLRCSRSTPGLLTELSGHRTPATLNDIPDVELDRVAEMGFDWVWLLSVWQTGEAAANFEKQSGWRGVPETLLTARRGLPFGFAITATRAQNLGGNVALDVSASGSEAKSEIDARLRPQPHGLDHRGSRVIRVLHRRDERDRPERRRIMSGSSASGRPAAATAAIRTLPLADTLQLNYGNPRFRTR